jgi:hypothetical protein
MGLQSTLALLAALRIAATQMPTRVFRPGLVGGSSPTSAVSPHSWPS